jgi:hypothetical protein
MDFEPWVDPPSEREQRQRVSVKIDGHETRSWRAHFSTNVVNKEHRVCAPESNQSPTREEPGGASCSEELRRSRSYYECSVYECARVFGVARPRPEGSAVALLQNVSNSFSP